MQRAIQTIRSFNRTVTQHTGALDGSFLGRGFPLGQARVLFEAGFGPIEVRRLRRRLGLDSGYVSRMLRALERKNLVATAADRADGRVRVVRLTAAGREELDELNRLADAGVASLLANLGPSQRERLVAAMSEVERLLRASQVTIARTDPSDEGARACIHRLFDELQERFEGGFDTEHTLPASDAELTPPNGYLFVARLGDQAVGCGALKLGAHDIGEVKRMWIAPELRGTGLGRRLLATIEEQARVCGVLRLRLETNRALEEARGLYAAGGFVSVAPFSDEPYADFWFEKRLDA